MSKLVEGYMKSVYRKAAAAEDLPWHRAQPPKLLEKAVRERPTRGRALDLGCGAGTYAIWLAQQGFEVTGVDYLEPALELTRAGAKQAGVTVETVRADVLAYQPERPFDVVIDIGCLHHLDDRERVRYRELLPRWVAPGGDFVLLHFLKQSTWDWRPIGPRRVWADDLRKLLGSVLTEKEVLTEVIRQPLPIGPRVCLGELWWRRAGA
jgi:SAM-dependent methyltransferase